MTNIFKTAFLIMAVLVLSVTARAEEAGLTVSDDPLTVSNIMISKEAANAVIARTEAMAEAKRQAVRVLAQRRMTADEFKNFQLPDDVGIGAVVQDLAIAREQLSDKQYAAVFTVRFLKSVESLLHLNPAPESSLELSPDAAGSVAAVQEDKKEDQAVPPPAATGVVAGETVTSGAVAGDAGTQTKASLLVLPYYENAAGKTVLWDDPNPWLGIWQTSPLTSQRYNIVVPLGDIRDVTAGSADTIWSGDGSVVEKMRQNYGVDHVALIVADLSGAQTAIEAYNVTDGHLSAKKTLALYAAGRDSAQSLRQGVQDVLAWLDSDASAGDDGKDSSVEKITRDIVPAPPEEEKAHDVADIPPAAIAADPAATVDLMAAGQSTFDAEMAFAAFDEWIDFQKRLASLTPSIAMTIKSITSNRAAFTLSYEGSVDVLTTLLAGKGIVLSPPSNGGRTYTIQLMAP